MEEKIYERQVTKQAISKRVIDEQQIDRHYAANDLAELYKFEPEPPEPRPVPSLPKDRLFAEMLKDHEKQVRYSNRDPTTKCLMSIAMSLWRISLKTRVKGMVRLRTTLFEFRSTPPDSLMISHHLTTKTMNQFSIVFSYVFFCTKNRGFTYFLITWNIRFFCRIDRADRRFFFTHIAWIFRILMDWDVAWHQLISNMRRLHYTMQFVRLGVAGLFTFLVSLSLTHRFS